MDLLQQFDIPFYGYGGHFPGVLWNNNGHLCIENTTIYSSLNIVHRHTRLQRIQDSMETPASPQLPLSQTHFCHVRHECPYLCLWISFARQVCNWLSHSSPEDNFKLLHHYVAEEKWNENITNVVVVPVRYIIVRDCCYDSAGANCTYTCVYTSRSTHARHCTRSPRSWGDEPSASMRSDGVHIAHRKLYYEWMIVWWKLYFFYINEIAFDRDVWNYLRSHGILSTYRGVFRQPANHTMMIFTTPYSTIGIVYSVLTTN